jgi:hypothetical protein
MTINNPATLKRRIVRVGNEVVEIKDHTAAASYVDVVLETATAHGTVMVSLGSFNRDIPEEPIIDVTHRLRMNAFTAQRLHAALGKIINNLQKQADQTISAANAARQATAPAVQPAPAEAPTQPKTSKRKRLN